MAMYSLNKSYPVPDKPERIRLSNGYTKTDSTTFSTDDLADAGWQVVGDRPTINETTHKVTWSGSNWVVETLPAEEVKNAQLQSVRTQRDKFINDIEWRIMRYHSFARQGKSQIDDIAVLDKYVQDLRDCINVDDPSATKFPEEI